MFKKIAYNLFKSLQKLFSTDNQHKYQHLSESQFPFSIELENGELISRGLGLTKTTTNKIQTAIYRHYAAPIVLLGKYYSRTGNLLFLFLFLLTLTSQTPQSVKEYLTQTEKKLLVYLLPTCISLFIFVTKELIYDNQKNKQDEQINQREVTIFKKMKKYFQNTIQRSNSKDETIKVLNNEDRRKSVTSQKFTHMLAQIKSKNSKIPIFDITQWQYLEVGDIVYLKKHEIAPADLLILDISDQKCLIHNQNMEGQTEEIEKFPTQLTLVGQQQKKQNGFEYKRILNGTLKYDKKQVDGRQGFIRLKKDPKGEDFGTMNIIQREQILVGCDYVYGLVLLAGQDCKCYQNYVASQNRGKKISFFYQKSDMYFVLSFFNIIIITLVQFRVSQQISWIIEDFTLCNNQQLEDQSLKYMTFIFFLNSYLQILPHYFYALVDLMEIINTLVKKHQYEQKTILNLQMIKTHSSSQSPTSQKQKNASKGFQRKLPIKYKQLNSSNVSDLVMSEYVCLDKTGTLTREQTKVKVMLISELIYKFSSKKMKINAWKNFKADINNQIASNQLIASDNEDNSDQEELEKESKLFKSPFRLTLVRSSSLKRKKSRNTINIGDYQTRPVLNTKKLSDHTQIGSKVGSQYLLFEKKTIADVRSPSIRHLNDNELKFLDEKGSSEQIDDMMENIKLEDLEDSHYKMSSTSNQKPKPFRNRPNYLVEQSQISSPQNASLSVMPLIQIIKQEEGQSQDYIREVLINKSLRQSQEGSKSVISDINSKRGVILRNSYINNQKGTKSIVGKLLEDQGELDMLDFQDQDDFYKKMQFGLKSAMYTESVLILALCHRTTTKFVYSEDCFINDAQLQLDNQLMKFAESFDIKFICSSFQQNRTFYLIQFKNELHEFEILAYHKETTNHQRFGVLLRFPQQLAEQFGFIQQNLEESAENFYSVFILRDEVLTLPSYLDLDKITKDYWDKYLGRIHIQGYRTVIFSKTYLTESETSAYMECYETLRQQLVFEEDEFEDLYLTLEKNMQLINVMGLEEKLRKEAVDTIKYFKSCNMKTWILSGDKFNRVLPIAYKTGITDKNLQTVNFDSTEYEEIKVLIKQQLQVMSNQLKTQGTSPKSHQPSKTSAVDRYARRVSLNKQSPEIANGFPSINKVNGGSMSRKSVRQLKLPQKNPFFVDIKKFNIFLNGETFEIIYRDRFLYNHFCFILYFSQALVAYNLQSGQKAKIVDVIHKQFPGNLKVLALGDAYNDLEMFRAADVGIQLQSMMQGFNENKERFEQFQRKNSLFQPKTKFFNRIQTNIKKKKHDENPTKRVFVHRALWQIPTADFIVQKFDELQWLIFFESRLFAEIYDDMLMFSFYRGFLLAFTQTIWFAFNCGTYQQVINFNMFIMFQSLYLISVFVFHAILKFNHSVKITEDIDIKIFQEQFSDNIRLFKKKKIISFILKINLNAICEAFIIFGFLQPLYNQLPDNDGMIFLGNSSYEFIFFGVVMSDILKYSTSAHLSTKQSLIMAVIYFMITVFYVSSEMPDPMNQSLQQPYVLTVLSTLCSFMILLAYLLIQYTLNKFINLIFSPLFSQPILKNKSELQSLDDQYLSEQSLTKDQFNRKVSSMYRKISNLTAKIFSSNENQEIDLSIQQMVSGGNITLGGDKLNPYTLQFTLKDVESKFRRVLIISWISFHRHHHLISTFSYELVLLLLYVYQKKFGAFFILFILSFSFGLLVAFFIRTEKYEKHFFLVNTFTVFVRVICKMLYDVVEPDYNNNGIDNLLITQLCSFVIIIFILDQPLIILIGCLAQTLSFMIRQSVDQMTQQESGLENWYLLLNKNVIALASFIVIAIIKYRLTYMERQEFLLDNQMKQETQQINDVLEILLPKFIRDRIDKSGQFDVSENQGDVSILFCDICGFDKIVNSENEKIVHLLDSLFRAFDSLCSQNGMQKIETVGKTYMAAGGLKAVDQNTKYANVDPVKRAINQAIEMQNFVKKFKFAKVGNLQIKIGIHYGRVIAGVIGHHKPQFSLIGDTVNTTSRVCSTGADGEITISEKAYEMVDMPELSFERREVEAKGKGIIVTYQVSTEVKRNRKYRQRQKLTINHSDPSNSVGNDTVGGKRKPQKGGGGESFNIIEEDIEFEKQSERKQSWVDIQSHSGDNKHRGRKAVHNRTRILKPSPPSSHSILRQQSQFLKSAHNLTPGDATPAPTPKAANTTFVEQKEEQSDNQRERQNLLQVLEQQLRKELVVEIYEENFDIEMDKDRARAQYMNDDGDLLDTKVEKLVMGAKRFYLDFDQLQDVMAQKFYNFTSQQDYKMCCGLILFSTVCFSFKSFSSFMVNDGSNVYKNAILTLRVLVCVMLFLLSIGVSSRYKEIFYQQNFFLISFAIKYFVFVFESCVIGEQYNDSVVIELQISEGILILNLFTSMQLIHINKKLFILIVYFLGMIIILSVQGGHWRYSYFIIISGILQFWLQYRQFGSQINNFNNKLLLEHKKQQQSNLVMYLLPQHILDEFYKPNQQRKALTDYCKDSTLLFADIVGFTDYSNHVEPEQVVNMLRNLFTEFDKTCLAQNAYKLYTIGDCYVVMGMTDASDRQPAKEARNVVELGFLMIEIIRQVRVIINFQGLDMRIGVHTGNIIGGVLGTEIVRYDIYGADVMIANKMESNGQKGQVQVSEETKQLLEATYPYDFIYEFNKTIEFTSIGRKTNGYLIFQAQNEESQSIVNNQSPNFQDILSKR